MGSILKRQGLRRGEGTELEKVGVFYLLYKPKKKSIFFVCKYKQM